jgi:hypothetical protein
MKPLSLDATLEAVAGLQRAFRLEGDRLVLTAPPAEARATIPPRLAASIAHHKPAIVATLVHPLVAHACQAFGIDRVLPLSKAGAADAFACPCFAKRQPGVGSEASAPAPTAASIGGA